MGEWLVVIGR